MMYRDEKIRVYRVSAHDYSGSEPCGTVLYADDKRGLGIRCADGLVTIDELKRSGARCMAAKDCMRGRPLESGYIFEKQGEQQD